MADRSYVTMHQNRISGGNSTGNAVPDDANKVMPEVTMESMAAGLTDDGLPKDSGTSPLMDEVG